jgi:hypothetical protein
MDVNLRDALDQGFGSEPPHPPVAARLEAGHRAVRRRRIAGGVVTVSVAAALGLGASVLAGSGPDRAGQAATDPTATGTATTETSTPTTTPTAIPTTATPDAWDDGDLARYTDDGTLEIRPGATVVQRIDEPFGEPTDANHSVALVLDFGGAETWLILSWEGDERGATSSTAGAANPDGDTFEEWVDLQVAANVHDVATYVEFASDGSLVSSQGVVILEQRHPVQFTNFAPGGAPTAAALVQGPSGKKWWVVVRDIDGVEIISTPLRTGGATMDDFLAYAKTQYDKGVGLR